MFLKALKLCKAQFVILISLLFWTFLPLAANIFGGGFLVITSLIMQCITLCPSLCLLMTIWVLNAEIHCQFWFCHLPLVIMSFNSYDKSPSFTRTSMRPSLMCSSTLRTKCFPNLMHFSTQNLLGLTIKMEILDWSATGMSIKEKDAYVIDYILKAECKIVKNSELQERLWSQLPHIFEGNLASTKCLYFYHSQINSKQIHENSKRWATSEDCANPVQLDTVNLHQKYPVHFPLWCPPFHSPQFWLVPNHPVRQWKLVDTGLAIKYLKCWNLKAFRDL